MARNQAQQQDGSTSAGCAAGRQQPACAWMDEDMSQFQLDGLPFPIQSCCALHKPGRAKLPHVRWFVSSVECEPGKNLPGACCAAAWTGAGAGTAAA